MNTKHDLAREWTELDLEDLDAVNGGGGIADPANKLGSYVSAGWSWGVVSGSTTTYTDLQGNSFQAVSSGVGLSVPGPSAVTGDVYHWDSQPNATLRDVALNGSWQEGEFDGVTTMNGSGYTVQTGGSPYLGFEHTDTQELGVPQAPVNDGMTHFAGNDYYSGDPQAGHADAAPAAAPAYEPGGSVDTTDHSHDDAPAPAPDTHADAAPSNDVGADPGGNISSPNNDAGLGSDPGGSDPGGSDPGGSSSA